MELDYKRMIKVLQIISQREIDDEVLLNRLFQLLGDIVNNLKEVLAYEDKDLKYDRMRWIRRGEEEGWWSDPKHYEKIADIESLTIQFAQMLKYGKIIKNDKIPNRLEENWWDRA